MSLRAAINAKCRECIYDPHSGAGNWRQQVTACTSYKCPLYPVRPTSAGKGAESGPDRDAKGGHTVYYCTEDGIKAL